MMVHIDVRGLDATLATVEDVPKQARYASMLAINETMLAVQTFTISELLPEKFTLRAKGAPWQKPGTKYGFNLKFATKQNPVGVLGSQADWLDLQERGGTKKVDGHRVAIPTPAHKAKSEIMTAAKKPKALLKEALTTQIRRASADSSKAGKAKLKRLNRQMKALSKMTQKPFLTDSVKNNLPSGIWVRTGKERLPIMPLFIFKEEVPIEIRLGFEPAGGKLAAQLFPQKFEITFQKAISTARRI